MLQFLSLSAKEIHTGSLIGCRDATITVWSHLLLKPSLIALHNGMKQLLQHLRYLLLVEHPHIFHYVIIKPTPPMVCCGKDNVHCLKLVCWHMWPKVDRLFSICYKSPAVLYWSSKVKSFNCSWRDGWAHTVLSFIMFWVTWHFATASAVSYLITAETLP